MDLEQEVKTDVDGELIRKRARIANLSHEAAEGIAKDVEAGTITLAEGTAKIFHELSKESDKLQIRPNHAAATAGRDQRDGMASAMGEALAARYTGKAPSDQARQYTGASTLDMARECLRASGQPSPGWGAAETIRLALHTTSDFPHLLNETGRRILLNAYDVATPALLQIARRSTALDFRAKAALRLGEAPKLLQVNESGEIKHGTRAESKESYKLLTYARMFSISRQALINDDLGAFGDFVSAFGVAAATLQGELLTALLVSNPTMGDTVALFNSGHGNITTGGGSALATAGLSGARKAMRQMKGMDGSTILDIAPKYLVVPSALETTGEQLIASISPTTVADVNVFSQKLQLVVDPRLDATSTMQWYLFADPDRVPVLEYSFLEGSEGPKIDQRDGWDVLGSEFRCYLDFGCGVLDFRGAHRAAGS